MGRLLTQNYTYAKYKEGANDPHDSCTACSAHKLHKHICRKRHRLNFDACRQSFTIKINTNFKARRQVKNGKRGNKKKILYQQERFFIHSSLIEHVPELDKKENCFKRESTFITKHQKSDKTNTIPVYVKKLNGEVVIVPIQFHSIEYVKKSLRQIEHIPEDGILIWFYGRILSSSVLSKVQPYDSLLIGIKGKGGMLDETIAISRDSSENEVKEWLKKRVGLTEDYIQNFPDFQYLDGKTLFAYLDSGAHELQSDLKIPIGVGRKILLYLKHNNQIGHILQYEMTKWNIHDVQKFIKDAVSVQNPDVDEICRIIKNEEIDGIVFFSYDNSKEFQKDLNEPDKFGVICKRIIARRDEQIKEIKRSIQVPTISPPICHGEDEKAEMAGAVEKETTINVKELEIHEIGQNNRFGIGLAWNSYIRNVLHLNTCNSRSNIKACNLKLIHSDWKSRNTLEKKALFLILTDATGNDDNYDEMLSSSLWDRIRKNIQTWYNHFLQADKNLFDISQKDDILLLNKKPISFSKNKVKLRYLTEKKIEELAESENVFLLISKSVLTKKIDCYSTIIDKPIPKKDYKPQFLHFTFESGRDYWIFDPDDFSFGFQLKTIPSNCCGKPQKGNKQIQDSRSDKFKHGENTVQLSLVDSGSTEIIQKPEKTIQISQNETGPIVQIQRTFKCDSTEIQYSEGHRISTAEHDGSVSFQCYEYKFVPDSLISKGSTFVIEFCNKEVIRFAGGCLNVRKNGTIMFGIGDSHGNKDFNGCFVHGEVVGVPVHDIPGDFISDLTDSLRIAISKCFGTHCSRTASMCIGNPVFVKVVTRMPSSPRYVIEVDIEPSSTLCKSQFFKINRSKIVTSKDIEKEYTLFVRENTGTVRKNKQEERLFVKTDLHDFIQKRLEDENQMLPSRISDPIETPMDRLRKHLCKGSNKLDKSIWPILVLNKPTDEQKENDQWLRFLKFIKFVDFHAVFDFDDESNINGLCAAYGNKENSILQDEEIFLDYSGNKLDLANKLGMPHDMKTVWIFSNGRSDIKPAKPYRGGTNWTNVYSAGIRDAVIFYSQKEIIPKGRALVIVLLFSNNLDGIVETFREIVVRFGWEQIAIIATELTLKRLISECRDMEEEIKERSVSGKSMTWEHVNATVLEITGNEDQENILLPTSAGAHVPADEKFVETLTEFHILSARQCENKKFKTIKEEEEFASEVELQFYRGEKVEWFNFFFESHVLKRHCFDRLKSSVGSILKQNPTNERDKKIIATVIIAHEPGAGGTTIARNLLWAFHKDYRCAIVTKITDRTSKNVMSLWQHKELNNARPLLLLIDELPQSDMTFEDLIRQIHVEYRSNPIQEGLICCFLVCQRENDIAEQPFEHMSPFSHSGHVVEHLKQKLTDSEIHWMDRKYEKLEQKGAEYQPEYLLSFMILREGFNQEYIKNTIKQFLTHLDMTSNEFELLEFTSLVSAYAPTSRRGPNVFIPLECCDALMGSKLTKTIFWEKNMSSTLKMFLIVEQKETASGMQIRMAHPALADAVLSQILENKHESLSSLTLRFLNCSILQSPSHGREMIIDFTREMLVRRLKEEYNDDKTTQFSPLVDDIRNKESWKNARDVLINGFEKMKDSYVAQTLARLCVRNQDFQTGISWAKQAVDMSIGKTANGFCHHTLAIVLDELFNHKTKRIQFVTPSEATELIALILDALDHFIEASRSRTGSADHILYPITGVLKAIIKCLKFITNKVQFSSEVDIKRFITEETYTPSELEEWLKFQPKFLSLSIEAEKAFGIVEQCLCFNTTFYAHDSMSSFPAITREHRLYRNLQYLYPNLFNDFRCFYGANANEVPQSNMPEVLNVWHRRCLIDLGGNSYMNICDILRQLRTKSKRFSSADAVKKCIEIKSHLMKICDRTSKDLTNLVSVNIILGLLGGEKRDPTKTILEYCKQIIKMKRGYEDIAYFFICILLWPSNQINIEYDDELFFESLRFLHRNREVNKGRPRDFKYLFLKEERNITQPTPQFFLTNGRGFNSLCHRFDIFFKDNAESQFSNAMWDNFGVKHNLKRLRGYLKFYEAKYCIRIINEKSTSSEHIDIRKIRTGKKEFLSEEEVYFFLGFSIGGPIAYNVKPTRHEDLTRQVHDPIPIDDKVEVYLQESEEELQKRLEYISELKSKIKNGRNLKERDKELMKNEDDIKTALEVKRNEIFSDID